MDWSTSSKNIIEGVLGNLVYSILSLVVVVVMGWLQITGWPWVGAVLYGLTTMTCLSIIRFCWFSPSKLATDDQTPRRNPPYVAMAMLVVLVLGTAVFDYRGRHSEQLPFFQIVTNYGVTTGKKGEADCHIGVDTSYLLEFREDYLLALVCGVDDSRVDQLEDTKIIVSGLFNITGKRFMIVTPFRGEMLNAAMKATADLSVWHAAVLIPKGKDVVSIRRLSDVTVYGGKILDERYYK